MEWLHQYKAPRPTRVSRRGARTYAAARAGRIEYELMNREEWIAHRAHVIDLDMPDQFPESFARYYAEKDWEELETIAESLREWISGQRDARAEMPDRYVAAETVINLMEKLRSSR